MGFKMNWITLFVSLGILTFSSSLETSTQSIYTTTLISQTDASSNLTSTNDSIDISTSSSTDNVSSTVKPNKTELQLTSTISSKTDRSTEESNGTQALNLTTEIPKKDYVETSDSKSLTIKPETNKLTTTDITIKQTDDRTPNAGTNEILPKLSVKTAADDISVTDSSKYNSDSLSPNKEDDDTEDENQISKLKRDITNKLALHQENVHPKIIVENPKETEKTENYNNILFTDADSTSTDYIANISNLPELPSKHELTSSTNSILSSDESPSTTVLSELLQTNNFETTESIISKDDSSFNSSLTFQHPKIYTDTFSTELQNSLLVLPKFPVADSLVYNESFLISKLISTTTLPTESHAPVHKTQENNTFILSSTVNNLNSSDDQKSNNTFISTDNPMQEAESTVMLMSVNSSQYVSNNPVTINHQEGVLTEHYKDEILAPPTKTSLEKDNLEHVSLKLNSQNIGIIKEDDNFDLWSLNDQSSTTVYPSTSEKETMFNDHPKDIPSDTPQIAYTEIDKILSSNIHKNINAIFITQPQPTHIDPLSKPITNKPSSVSVSTVASSQTTFNAELSSVINTSFEQNNSLGVPLAEAENATSQNIKHKELVNSEFFLPNTSSEASQTMNTNFNSLSDGLVLNTTTSMTSENIHNITETNPKSSFDLEPNNSSSTTLNVSLVTTSTSTVSPGPKILKPKIRFGGDPTVTRAPISKFLPPKRPTPEPSGTPVSIFRQQRTRRPSITSSTTAATIPKYSRGTRGPLRIIGTETIVFSLPPTTTPSTTTEAEEEEDDEEEENEESVKDEISSFKEPFFDEDKHLVKITGDFVIDKGLRWRETLNNRDSPEFKKQSERMLRTLQKIFQDTSISDYLHSIEVDGFVRKMKGSRSVIVDYSLYLRKTENPVETSEILAIFNDRLVNNTYGRYTFSPESIKIIGSEAFIRIRPTEKPDIEPPIPQWAIAVIVIGAASFIFIVLFAAVTAYGRHHMRRRYANKLNDDDIERSDDSKDWENKLGTSAYENLAADGIYDIDDSGGSSVENMKSRSYFVD